MKITEAKLKGLVLKTKRERPRGECLSEERLAAFAEDRMTESEKDLALGHLSRCPVCLETARIVRGLLNETAREQEARVPVAALTRAMKLDPAAKSMIEVVIRFVKGAAEVVRMSADVMSGLAPAVEAVRGEGRVVSDTLVTFTKSFPPYLAEVDVEKTRSDLGEITLRFTDEHTRRPAENLRVSLFESDRELESAMIAEGLAVFENLKFGQYRLEITKVGEPVGRITLAMKGEGQ
jgi:hypothetical protein